MTREEVDDHMKIHVMNICLAVASKQDGAIRECKELLVEKVYDMIQHARGKTLVPGIDEYMDDNGQ